MKNKVTIREFKSKHHPQLKWVVYWPADFPGKPRKSRRFKTKSDADKFLQKKEIQLANQGRKVASIHERIVEDAVWATHALEPLGVSLRDAVAEYVKRHGRLANSILLSDALGDFLETKRKAGKSDRYLADLGAKCHRFVEDHEGLRVSEIEVQDVDRWLEDLNVGAITRNNYRRVLSVFFAWSEKRGFCPDNPVRESEKAKEVSDRVEIFTPPELRAILAASPSDLIPFFAIGAFAGLRSEEIRLLRWENLDFLNRRIDVTAKISKSAANRFVPLRSPLFEWLQPVAKSRGPVAPTNVYDRLKKFRRKLADGKFEGIEAVEWKQNGMRHSFGSYALAECENAGQVALWLGHDSNRMIFKHYRERVTPEAATEWFAVLPDESEISKIA